ncbi:fimbrial biogenesis chaperone [Azospirillum soli]|uniref:fimbrial biogenesis chaperone n=1 Tax=Azospirillum soli TaxID=1304799 RepID=UPI001AE2B9A9|nr:fimbria/pilus periplasmic chaperone [Azospirillum soli]MBP2313877.1 fimbrial chaperone protein [Azospirillum soli]
MNGFRLLGSAFVFTCLLLAQVSPASAFRLVPIEMEFAPSGRGATQIFRLENDTAEPVAIEVSLMTRRMTEQGEDQLEPAGENFAIFPEQIVLQGNQSQSVRVQWMGNANPSQELAFRLVAEQLPVDLGKAPLPGGQVRLLVRYVASVYVTPQGAKPDPVVTSVAPQGKALAVTVTNRGTSRQILRDATLTVTGGGKTVTLRGEQLTGLLGENVLAGATRRFSIPLPAGLPQGPLSATLAAAPR